MKQLKNIQARLSGDLDAMNGIIRESLATPNRMMNDIVTRYLEVKGKQIRPLLVILSARMFGGVTDEVLYAGAALEMLHNASLIHDDVVDETMLRRGVPTVNSRMGNHVAVLVGDFFVSNALAAGIRTGNIAVISALSQLGKELSLGEIDQISNAREGHYDEESYLSMIHQKTASLFMNCVGMGADVVGAPEERKRRLVRFAELLGLCFQIRDDIFDYFDGAEIGKPTGNDLREGKVTLPLLYALDNAPEPARTEMRELLNHDALQADEISQLIEFAKANGGIDYAYSRMRDMQQEAAVELADFPESDSKQSFLDIFDYIIERTL